MRMKSTAVKVICMLVFALPVEAQQQVTQDRVTAMKAALQQDQARLRQYEWIETTVVRLKGDEKARKQHRCYYGADGGVQKIATGVQEQAKSPRGLRGRVAAKKKGELTEYMQQAIDMVQLYVPPEPARLQRSKDSGKALIRILEPDRRALIEFGDYLKPGDTLGVEIDLSTNRLLGLRIETYLETPEDPVGLEVSFATLADGTGYPSRIVLEAKAKKMDVTVENSGYRRTGS
jgi:hypothetical protein